MLGSILLDANVDYGSNALAIYLFSGIATLKRLVPPLQGQQPWRRGEWILKRKTFETVKENLLIAVEHCWGQQCSLVGE